MSRGCGLGWFCKVREWAAPFRRQKSRGWASSFVRGRSRCVAPPSSAISQPIRLFFLPTTLNPQPLFICLFLWGAKVKLFPLGSSVKNLRSTGFSRSLMQLIEFSSAWLSWFFSLNLLINAGSYPALERKKTAHMPTNTDHIYIIEVPFVRPSFRPRKPAAYFCAASRASRKVCLFQSDHAHRPSGIDNRTAESSENFHNT